MPRDEVTTDGRTQLKAWIAADGRGSQARLAKRLGVTTALVNQWLAGLCRPGQVYRDALEVTAGIDPRDWETGGEREKRRRAMTGEPETKGAA